MTITVEDGTGLSSANSYATEAELSTYATARGVTISGDSEALLIQGMDYIEEQRYIGVKASDGQALQWPRYGAWVDGYYISETAIPQKLKDAQCEVALGIDAGNSPLATADRATIKEKVGDIEVTYANGTRDLPYLTAVHNKLNKLTKSGTVAVRG